MIIQKLQDCLGPEQVITDPAERGRLSTDIYRQGSLCAAAIRPTDTESLARAARLITDAGYALVPRGGGMSYTGGYTTGTEEFVTVDTSQLTGIVSLDAGDMTLTVRAGTTWETIYEALKPHGLRLPFFGTFSGRIATVGGGLSNGAVFFGTARYGTAADNVLGLEVVCADGRVLRTGQAAFDNGKAFYRTHGPDLTGLFLHDCGVLGIKTEATFKLIEMPEHIGALSSAFADADSAAAALSAIGRSGCAEEAYVFDPHTTARNMEAGDLQTDLRTLGKIVSNQSGVMAGLKAGARVVAAGKNIVPADSYSLHLTCAGRSEAAVADDLARCATMLGENGGIDIPNSIPLAVRAAPFDHVNGVLGPNGERWVALNAKVAHSDASALITDFDAIISLHRTEMSKLKVTASTLFIAMDTHAFSFEPVFHWPDQWLAPHRHVAEPAHLASLTEPAANPAAAQLVAELREQTIALFNARGVASNQIGRTYAYRERLEPNTRRLVDALKSELDPAGLMNPGALGYPPC